MCSRTVEFPLFKYSLTGVDDRSIQVGDRQQRDRAKVAAKLELLDAPINEAEQSVKSFAEDREDLGARQSRLEETMETALRVWDEASAGYRDLSARRRTLRAQRDEYIDRSDEIELLFARLSLLARHYGSDLSRLQAIEEAASIFRSLGEGPCPWCGADIAHRGEHAVVLCEGDTEAIWEASRAEQSKIEVKRHELHETVIKLERERRLIDELIPGLDGHLRQVDEEIRGELPDIQEARVRIAQVVAARDVTQSGLARYENLDRLRELRSEIVSDADIDSVSLIAEGGVDTTVLDEFSQSIEYFLTGWSFPAQRVFFDLPRRDIQVSGKARRVNGKGVRAVLHAAFSLGLMRYTSQRNKPHTRFLILDSPLVTYRDPLSEDDITLAHSNLNERFYEPFRDWDQRLQVIVIENRDPPEWVNTIAKVERFTGTISFGRAGFYFRSGRRCRTLASIASRRLLHRKAEFADHLLGASGTSGPCRSPSSGTRRRSASSAGSCSGDLVRGSRRGARPSLGALALPSGAPRPHLLAVLRRRARRSPAPRRSSGWRVEELLDLARVDVLAAADDHVLDAADDVDVALVVHRSRGRRCASSRRRRSPRRCASGSFQ